MAMSMYWLTTKGCPPSVVIQLALADHPDPTRLWSLSVVVQVDQLLHKNCVR